MIEFKLETAAAGGDAAPAVTIIGIGGAGANVLDHLALEGMDGVELISMNCDVRSLTSSMAQRKVQLGREITQGLGCGGDPELGQEAAASSLAEIREVLGGRRMIFVCVGLGGGTGSGAAPLIARMARETGAFVIVFATLPFVFEGKRRMAQAHAALEDIRRHANALVCFENDKMGELVLPKKGVTEAFELADRMICQSVRAVATVATQPGLIRIGMDDLISALRNADSRCLFGFGQAKGEARASEALQLALRSPLLDRGQLLEKARNVLVHICGGHSMTLFEIETLMRELTKHVSDEAQILFGAAVDAKLADSITVTIISSLSKARPALPEAAPVAEVQPEAPRPKPAVPVTPIITQHTQAIPILSVQPRQMPQPPPSSSLSPSATNTVTIATSTVPVLRMEAGMAPPSRPVKPVRPAPLAPPVSVEPDLFSAPVAEAPTVPAAVVEAPPVPAPAPVAAPPAPAPVPVVAEAPASPVVEAAPAEPEPAPVTVTAEAVEEEIKLLTDAEIDALIAAQDEEEAVALDEEAGTAVQAVIEAEAVPETIIDEEIVEEEVIEEVLAEETPVIVEEYEEEVVVVAEEEAMEEEEYEEAAPAAVTPPEEEEIELEDEAEVQHPAFAADRETVTSAPMRPIEVQPPAPRVAAQQSPQPQPARKFDLREILQRQRQTRLAQHQRPAAPAPKPEAPVRPAAHSPQAQPPARPAPARPAPAPAPAAPSRPVPERTPDPSRITPIRPIPPAQPVHQTAAPRVNSPFTGTKPPASVPVRAHAQAQPQAQTRQATFDERLAPAARTGRFEKAEPTVEEGEDLDVPTFLRKKR